MSETPEETAAPGGDVAAWVSVLAAWLFLAAFAQIIYLMYWPMYVLGTPLPRGAALVVAFLRLGVYAGLAWGLARRESAAWAGTVFELARTVLLFLGLYFLRGRMIQADFFPASWVQGVLSAALPVVALFSGAVAGGWHPGTRVDVQIAAGVAMFGGACAISGLWLREQWPAFGVRAEDAMKTLWMRGLPPAALLTVAEGAALFIATRSGG
ncbi:MAG TPA: hypothetical protein VK689_21195 [Armatimonadota bacterium]|nr:hypothetical protein [Armatimonadota bacterium]